jgi:hypothetical protein
MRKLGYFSRTLLVTVLLIRFAGSAMAAIIVYDSELDFSDVNNPNGVWSYLNGSTLLAHYTPVPGLLNSAVPNGFWGQSAANLNGAIMRSSAGGSTTGFWSNNDFAAGNLLIRTADPNNGGPVRITFTAPTAGQLTYGNSYVWYADAPSGPFSNDFTLALNNGPLIESGTVGLGSDLSNPVILVNGFNILNVQAGDELTLAFQADPNSPVGTLTGIKFVVDFTSVPEPSNALFTGLFVLGCLGSRRR